MQIKKFVKSILSEIKQRLIMYLSFKENISCYNLSKRYLLPGDFKRIYFFHIRKCGGTSLNYIFLSCDGGNGSEVYKKLTQTQNFRIISNDKVFVGWNKNLIERGSYFYAFSHIPHHELDLPKKTFTITILRNPLDRVISHYKMLLYYKTERIFHPCMKEEGRWLGNSFSDFLTNLPKEHLLRQLYMFSKTFNQDEAFKKIINCSHFFFLEDFSEGVEELSKKLEMRLQAMHVRKADSIDFLINLKDLETLNNLLQSEFYLINKLKNYKKDNGKK